MALEHRSCRRETAFWLDFWPGETLIKNARTFVSPRDHFGAKTILRSRLSGFEDDRSRLWFEMMVASRDFRCV
ncbi:hypothetical protein BH10BDE1_BH10BDE1_34800 [soil metagenome]